MKAIVFTRYGSADDLEFKDVAKRAPANDEVLFIGEETPNASPPPQPRRQVGPVVPRRRSAPSSDDDVFYIGDEE